ncbi:MAG: histidinol-phosphatase HisJ family protein [Kiritimatiellia bacterium]
MLPDDSHIHTPLCRHARGEVSQYRDAARRLGLRGICFTDHAPAPCGYDPKNRMALDQFESYRLMVTDLQSKNGPAVRFGIEADYYPGCENFLPAWLADQDFDMVIGAVHFIDNWGFDDPDEHTVWKTVNVEDAWRRYFEIVTEMVTTGMYDVVAHLDLPKKFGYRPRDAETREMAAPVLDAVAGSGMAVEINTSGLRRPAKEIYPSQLLLDMAAERGIPICFGSDAHDPADAANGFKEAVKSACDAGYAEWVRYENRSSVKIPLEPV